MFAGKSSELIRRLHRYKIANRRCLTIKYDDGRYGSHAITSHNLETATAEAACELLPLKMKYDLENGFDVVCIDEAQFFPDLVQFCDEMASLDKTVIVSGLSSTFERKGFDSILGLIPLADSILKLKAICAICYSDGLFTRLTDEALQHLPSSQPNSRLMGGADKYQPLCRRCYMAFH